VHGHCPVGVLTALMLWCLLTSLMTTPGGKLQVVPHNLQRSLGKQLQMGPIIRSTWVATADALKNPEKVGSIAR
jgi:hypothetical protein